MTVPELEKELEVRNIDYNKSALKPEKVSLLERADENG